MKILYLTSDIDNKFYKQIFKFLLRNEDGQVNHCTKPLLVQILQETQPDWLVSYGYQHIIPPYILAYFQGKTANLHISYLPNNRGADPNLWSWLDNTLKGVTIHQIDKTLDTGAIYARRLLNLLPEKETLESSYNNLHLEIIDLFIDAWNSIKTGHLIPREQTKGGSYHRTSDKGALIDILPQGYKTPIKTVIETYQKTRRK